LVLFSTACFAVMLGLNISSALKSVIAIYITIPFILVPLILLSGIIVKYDKMHYSISSNQYVPVVGDMMASRWAYEALMVSQFKDNAFQENYYPLDREFANLSFELNFLIPAIYNKLNDYERLIRLNPDDSKLKETRSLVRNAVKDLQKEFIGVISGFEIVNEAGELNLKSIHEFLNSLKTVLIKRTNSLIDEKDAVYEKMKKQGISSDDFIRLKEGNFNRSVAEMVLNTNEMIKITDHKGRFIRKDSPIYQYPLSPAGRAQFYSGGKRIGSWEIDTLWFNISVLWFMTILLYVSLITGFLKKSLNVISSEGKQK